MGNPNPLKENQFKKGAEWTGNAKGRPKGSISVIGALKKAFEENPEQFEEFLARYKSNPNNEKHITEMIDGKAQAKLDVTTDGEAITPLLVKFIDDKSDDNGDTS